MGGRMLLAPAPAHTVVPDGLDQAVQSGTISKYTLAARQIIVYLERLKPDQIVTLRYQVRASYPIKGQTPLSQAYPYYNPSRVALSLPAPIVVHR